MAGSRQFTAANSESLTRADSATLSTGDIDFSFSIWVYTDVFGAYRVIAGKSAFGTGTEWVLFYDNSTSKYRLDCQNSGGSVIGTVQWATTPLPGEWNLICIYHDSVNNLVGISVNGAAFTTAATTGVISDLGVQFGIGVDGAVSHWDGRLARAGFWKNRVLTQADALSLYNNGDGRLYAGLPSGLTTNLTCWWDLSETSGDATDSVGSQTLTDNNTVTANRGPEESRVYMTCGFELGPEVTAYQPEIGALTGTCTVQTTVKRTGAYAFQFNPATTAVGHATFKGIQNGALSSASSNTELKNGFFRGYFRYATKPAANNERILTMYTTADTAKLGLRLSSTGALLVYDEATGPTLLATSTTLLAQDTWYRIEVATGYGTMTWRVRIYANDTSASGASAAALESLSGSRDQLSVNFSSVNLGKRANHNGQTIDCFWDDCAIGDSWIGAGRVGVLKTAGAGSVNTFTTGTYADVDENPNDADTTYLTTSTVGHIFLGDMENLGTAGIAHGKINLVEPIVVVRRDGGSGATTVSNRFKSGGTTTTGGAASAGAAYQGCFGSFHKDPDSGNPWTANLVNGIECGVILQAQDTSIRVTSVVAVVDFGWAVMAEDNPGQIAKNRPPRAIGPPGRIPKTNFLLIPPGRMGRDGIPYVADSPDLLTGLVEAWEMDETGTGNRVGAHASIAFVPTGDATNTTGKISNGVTGNPGVELNATSNSLNTTTQDYSIYFWVNHIDNITWNMYKDDGSPFYFEYTSPGYGAGQQFTAAIGNTTLSYEFTAAEEAFPLGAFIAITVDRDGQCKMYVDGTLRDTDTTDLTGVTDANGPLKISIDNRQVIDLVRFYNVIHGQDEVSAHYNSGNGLAYASF